MIEPWLTAEFVGICRQQFQQLGETFPQRPLAELPVMAKGRGVLLQRYRDARLTDVASFTAAGGLSWKSGRGMRSETDLRPYAGKRGQVGHTVPRGFPASGRFAG